MSSTARLLALFPVLLVMAAMIAVAVFVAAASHAAPSGGRSYSARGFQSRSAHTYAGGNAVNGHHGLSGVSHSFVAGNRAVSGRMMRRNAGAVGHALSSPQIRSGLRTSRAAQQPSQRGSRAPRGVITMVACGGATPMAASAPAGIGTNTPARQ